MDLVRPQVRSTWSSTVLLNFMMRSSLKLYGFLSMFNDIFSYRTLPGSMQDLLSSAAGASKVLRARSSNRSWEFETHITGLHGNYLHVLTRPKRWGAKGEDGKTGRIE